MSEKKGWGSSVLGLFVVRDEENAENAENATAAEGSAPASPEGGTDGAADAAGAPQPEGGGFVQPPPAAPGGKVDFAAVYAAAGIGAEEQARVAKAAELLHAIPGGEAAKPIVEASLKAFGVPVEKILEAGEKEIRALEGYVAAGAADTKKVLADSAQRIAEYQQEIQRIRQVMDERVAEQQGVERSCGEGKLEVQRVLDFFGHAGTAPGPSERSV